MKFCINKNKNINFHFRHVPKLSIGFKFQVYGTHERLVSKLEVIFKFRNHDKILVQLVQ